MFKQIENLAGGEVYLITSLIMFMIFFLIVGIYLLKMSKVHITEMSNLPINESTPNEDEKV